ncbi:DNA recombination protein RmuC [Methylotuvimicrobium sp. KM2]|uniref:DNA recombination protein RmuC n=1 Tax=Methylotuvimicrobium sp. KM2 TaxID=3133976 RepID=UPI003101A38D
MLDPLLLSGAAAVFLSLITLLLILVLRKVSVLSRSNAEQIRLELIQLLQRNEESLKHGLGESRKELREVSAENRREMSESFKDFQDTLLKRVVENGSEQNRQLAGFKDALNALSEKLITNSNDFKQSVSASFLASSDSLNKKQDEFREKTLEKLDAFEESIKTDAKENRQELNAGLKSFEEKSAHSIQRLSEQLQTRFSEFNKQQDAFGEKTIGRLNGFQEGIQNDAKENRKELKEALKSFEDKFGEGLKDFNDQLRLRFSDLHKQQQESTQQAKTSIAEIRETIEKQLKSIRDDNTTQLNEMRRTVDEKLHETLEKRLGESFKHVSDRLEQVHKGLGEMQNLAVGVGDLKKVLSNVKTRGILGEYQLGNILEQILSPDQYDINVATKKGSQANVEFAVKLPGKADDKTVWLPIDSKFPLESYQSLLLAFEEGDTVKINLAQKQLLNAVESFAKDISGKYIDPPNTTDFAIMFLPVESLYAEILRHPELFEKLQRTYRITITGPTTLSALLNSLHMGFRTLAVQKRSSEVWKVLAEVKTEFLKYADQLEKVKKHLHTASNSLETLQTTRANAMERKLRNVETLEIEVDGEPLVMIESDSE